jgi:3-phosphoshikimate 1-carboxyvinyltransferase
MLRDAGISLSVNEVDGQRTVLLQPGRPEAREWIVPQDPSQAAFFVVAAAIHPDADLEFQSIYGGVERNGYLGVLERMGAVIERNERDNLLDLRVRSSSLEGTVIHSNEIPSVDEVPALVVAATAASGTTTFVDMAELRLKESDRFANSVGLARSLGAQVDVDGDSFTISGLGSSRSFLEPMSSHPGDHRMTMATAIAGICGSGAEIEFPESTHSSFPNFFELLTSLSS